MEAEVGDVKKSDMFFIRGLGLQKEKRIRIIRLENAGVVQW